MFSHPNYEAIGQGELFCVEWGRQLSGANLAASTRVDLSGGVIPHWMMVTAVGTEAMDTNGAQTLRCRLNWGIRGDVERFKVLHTPDTTITDPDLLPMDLLGGGDGVPLYISPTLFPQGSEVVWSIRPDVELLEVRLTFWGYRIDPESHLKETLAHRGYAGIAFTPLTCAATATLGTPGPNQITDFRLGPRPYDFVADKLSCRTERLNSGGSFLDANDFPLHFRMRSLYDERDLILPNPRFATTMQFGQRDSSNDADSVATPFPGRGMLIPHNNGLHLEAHTRLVTTGSIRGYWLLHGSRRVPTPQESAEGVQ